LPTDGATRIEVETDRAATL